MRTNKLFMILAVIMMLALVFSACGGGAKAPDASAAKLIAAADISYPPFEYMEGDVAVGFDVDMWKEIGVRLGRETVHENYGWDGLIPGLLAKKFDVIMSDMGITEARLEQVDFSIPYFKQSFGIGTKVGSDIKKLEDLGGKIVGIQTGTMGEKWLRDNEAALGVKEIIPYEVMPDGILDLQAGRIDAVVNDRPFLNYIMKDSSDVYLLPDVSFGDDILIGIAVNKDNAELTAKINTAIEEIVADGTYATIYEKWFGTAPAAADMPL